VTAPEIFLILLGKLALGATLFVGMFSFGLWLGRIGFGGESKND
jgi:hypothetical protein